MPNELEGLLSRGDTTIDDVAGHLDRLEAAPRVDALATLGRTPQRRMYTLAAGSEPLTLEHFVPAQAGVLTEVIHRGRNTLPLPGPFKFFEKRFCRPDDGSARLFGYNEGASRPIVGPGYFVAYSTQARGEWKKRGSVVVDYFMVPDAAVVPGWPKVVPNSSGLQIVVFNGTRDFMRRVSQHVSIGAAYKGESPLDQYFVLCRMD